MCFEGATNVQRNAAAYTAAKVDPEAFGRLSQKTVAEKKSFINQQGGMEPLPPDVADALLRQAGTGRVMKARTGSTKNSFFAQAFSGPFSTQSILGDY